MARLAELVRVSGSDLGFVIDPDGELAVVVDDTGHVLEPEELLLSVVALIKEACPGAGVAVPVNVTERGRADPGRRRAAVVRTELSGRQPHGGRGARGVTFAGTPDGGCIWPDFLPAYDAAVTLGEAARPARRGRPPAVDGGRARCPRSTWRTRRS